MKLFRIANRYCRESSWKTLALLKICLFSIGIIVGILIPKERKKIIMGAGAAAFLATYIPLMGKFFLTWKEEGQEDAA